MRCGLFCSRRRLPYRNHSGIETLSAGGAGREQPRRSRSSCAPRRPTHRPHGRPIRARSRKSIEVVTSGSSASGRPNRARRPCSWVKAMESTTIDRRGRFPSHRRNRCRLRSAPPNPGETRLARSRRGMPPIRHAAARDHGRRHGVDRALGDRQRQRQRQRAALRGGRTAASEVAHSPRDDGNTRTGVAVVAALRAEWPAAENTTGSVQTGGGPT